MSFGAIPVFGQAFEYAKDVAAVVSTLIGVGAAAVAASTYASNSRRERARWAVQLYEKFYETPHYKKVRDELDCDPDDELIKQQVQQETAAFTDYLNFFELLIFLVKSKQLRKEDVLGLFEYYLLCLKRHNVVMGYINDDNKGFEQLSGFLSKIQI